MHNPAPGSRIRSIRALNLGLAPMPDVCRALVGATDWLAARRGKLWGRTGICGLTGGVGCAAAPFQKEFDPPESPLDYSGLRGEPKRQLKWLPADGQHFFLTCCGVAWHHPARAHAEPAVPICGTIGLGVSVSGTRHTRAGYPSDLLNQVNRCLEKCLPLLIGLGIKNPLSEACHALTK